jgi:hypothetical protein
MSRPITTFSEAQEGDSVVQMPIHPGSLFPNTVSFEGGKGDRSVGCSEYGFCGSAIHPVTGQLESAAFPGNGRYVVRPSLGGHDLTVQSQRQCSVFKKPPGYEDTACDPHFVITDGSRKTVHSLRINHDRVFTLGPNGVSYVREGRDEDFTFDSQRKLVRVQL